MGDTRRTTREDRMEGNGMSVTGLTAQEVRSLTGQGKTNQTTVKSGKSVGGIIFSNVFTYFNGIFCLLSVLLIATGSYKNLTFLPVVVGNTLIGIIQQLRSKKVLDELALLDVTEYKVIRDGEEGRVLSDQLVLGDVICLESGQQIPADAVVIASEASVNESLLTGEADEIQKKPGSELKSGSFLVGGTLTAKLTHVGADSYAAQLTVKAKEVKESRSEMIRDIERIVKVAGILIIPIGGALLYQAVFVNGASYQDAVSSMVGAVIGMIPEGLYLLVTIALALSAARLARNQVLLHDMRSIETMARIDVLCVDKTGTITSDVMEVNEIFGATGESEAELDAARNILAGYVRTVPDSNATMTAIREYLPETTSLEAVSVTPFSSKNKYSEVVTADGIYHLGAPEFLLSDAQLTENETIIEERTRTGQRVLALTGDANEDFEPILFVALRNEIRDNAEETFAGFAAQGVEVKVISGDNPLTVSRVATEAGIENAERYVDAGTLDTPEGLNAAVTEYTVFGRVKPEQKKALVEALKSKGLRVAMTGDGVNDILAMKEADCSVAMGSGSDAARQSAQVVLLDSDFSHMRKIVSEGRRDINNITRSATLFLYKNIFSLLLAVFSIYNAFSYPLQPAQVSLISMFNIGLPAFLLALEANEKKQADRFIHLTMMGALPAALTSFFAIAALVLFAKLFDISDVDVSTASTYLLSVVGFLILWNITKPMNRWRAAVFLVCIAGFLICDGFLNNLFGLRELSVKASVLCVVFAIAELSVMRALGFALYWIENHGRRILAPGSGAGWTARLKGHDPDRVKDLPR